MADATPYFDLKLARAAVHVEEFKRRSQEYLSSCDYDFTGETYNDHRIARLSISPLPERDLAIVAGDVLYNVRSCLDQVAAALVPRKHRRDVMFPIFHEGVWDEEIKEKADAAHRWQKLVGLVHPDAVPVLKGVQPLTGQETNGLRMLNALCNRDKHFGALSVDPRLVGPQLRSVYADGRAAGKGLSEDEGMPNGEPVRLDLEVTEFAFKGDIVLVLDAPHLDVPGGFRVPDVFDALLAYTSVVLTHLRPYVVDPD